MKRTLLFRLLAATTNVSASHLSARPHPVSCVVTTAKIPFYLLMLTCTKCYEKTQQGYRSANNNIAMVPTIFLMVTVFFRCETDRKSQQYSSIRECTSTINRAEGCRRNFSARWTKLARISFPIESRKFTERGSSPVADRIMLN